MKTIEESIAAVVEAKVRLVVREELRAALAELRPAPTTALLTVDEVAERCGGVTCETVRGWIHEKTLRATKVGARYLVAPADLDRFVAQGTVAKLAAVDSDDGLADVLARVHRMESNK